MSVILSILANPDADDPIDDDEVSHKHCNRIPPMYKCTYIHPDMQPGIRKIRLFGRSWKCVVCLIGLLWTTKNQENQAFEE